MYPCFMKIIFFRNFIFNTVPSREGSTSSGYSRTGSSSDIMPGGYGTGGQDMVHGSQVVAVGTPLATASLPLGAQQGPVMVWKKLHLTI